MASTHHRLLFALVLPFVEGDLEHGGGTDRGELLRPSAVHPVRHVVSKEVGGDRDVHECALVSCKSSYDIIS